MTATDTPIVKPEVVFMEELLDELHSGKLRIPRFQRPFVWKPSEMLELFDSLYQGYPIGSLLFWESSEPLESHEYIGPIRVPSPPQPLTYILDGQQRLTTIFVVLRILKETPKGPNQSAWRWWIWFDLKKREFIHINRADQNEPEPWLLPLRSVLRTVDFLAEARRLEDQCPDEAPQLIAEAESLAQKLKNYRVAIIRIQGGSLDQAVQIFSRLNSLGQRVTPDQMVSALTYRESEGAQSLANHIDEILERLADYHFGGVRRMTVFRAILAVADKDVNRSDWEEIARSIEDDFPQAAKAAGEALCLATRFLYEQLGVPGDRLLPYNNQLLLLSAFFHRCPAPQPRQEKYLRQWFWLSSISSWLASVNPTQLNQALQEMRDFATDASQGLQLQLLKALVRPFPETYDSRSARVRTLLIFMLSLQPLDPETGQPIETNQILHDLEKHVLARVFSRHSQKQIMSHPVNRLLLNRLAGKSVRNRLCSLPEDKQEKILQSHGISFKAYKALQQGDAHGFINTRARHLAELERNFMHDLGIELPSDIGFAEADIDTDET